eukprot:7505131-Pyramimonas_sp.AAC.1
MFDEGQLVRACGQSPILREKYIQSVVGNPSADALPRHTPGDDEEICSILQHSRSYYYDRLIVTVASSDKASTPDAHSLEKDGASPGMGRRRAREVQE